jgi:hypothetical protein
MGYVFFALWQGIVAGAVTKPGTSAAKPAYSGLFASVAEALYSLGYTISAIVVHGKSPG